MKKNDEELKQVAVLLSKKDHEKAKEIAASQGLTFSPWVRSIIKKHLTK